MNKLFRTQRVLHRGYLLRPRIASPPTPLVRFGGETTTLQMDHETWVDMGSPEAVTITVEPGNLLNE